MAGSRVGNLDLPFDKYWGNPARQKVVQIDVDPVNIGVTRPVALGIVSDVKPALEGLLRILKGRKVEPRDDADLQRYRQTAEAWWDEQFQAVKDWAGPGIHPSNAVRVVGEVFGRDAIYQSDGGMTGLWMHWFLPATRPGSYNGIRELGMLGTGIPCVIGARLAEAEREILCITGDGAAGFNFMEMQSAARENLRITVVVFAEGAWTMEEPNEMMQFGKTFGTDMGTVRWDKVAEGLGCHGEYVDRIKDLGPALTRAREARGPSVVCVKTDHGANLAVPESLFMRFFEVYQGPLG